MFLRTLHDGGAQVAAAALRHPAAAAQVATIELLDVEAGGGHELAGAALIFGMKHGQDLGQDGRCPYGPETGNGPQEGLLLADELLQLFVELGDLVNIGLELDRFIGLGLDTFDGFCQPPFVSPVARPA